MIKSFFLALCVLTFSMAKNLQASAEEEAKHTPEAAHTAPFRSIDKSIFQAINNLSVNKEKTAELLETLQGTSPLLVDGCVHMKVSTAFSTDISGFIKDTSNDLKNFFLDHDMNLIQYFRSDQDFFFLASYMIWCAHQGEGYVILPGHLSQRLYTIINGIENVEETTTIWKDPETLAQKMFLTCVPRIYNVDTAKKRDFPLCIPTAHLFHESSDLVPIFLTGQPFIFATKQTLEEDYYSKDIVSQMAEQHSNLTLVLDLQEGDGIEREEGYIISILPASLKVKLISVSEKPIRYIERDFGVGCDFTYLHIILPALEKIGRKFFNSTPLEHLNISMENITHIGQGFFTLCKKLKYADFTAFKPEGIERDFFSGCSDLEYLRLHMPNVKTIINHFVCQSPALTELEIYMPEIRSIDRYFLWGCPKINHVDLSCFSQVQDITGEFLGPVLRENSVTLPPNIPFSRIPVSPTQHMGWRQ